MTILVAGVAMLLFCLFTTASSASAAGPRQATTTTAPPMLPVTPESTLPTSGVDSGRLAGLAVSAILIGWGICSFGRGVRLTYAVQLAATRERWRHARRPRHSAGFTWR
ncbi:MAG TPA: hypothetical protein VFV00_20120 [Acidimicrobiales bacterium]|nr:hypothetical protein [Acidimicrobiales bacterium]